MDEFEILEEYLEYLDELRKSGITNMFGAGRFLTEQFGLTKQQSNHVLSHWMETFDERGKTV